ncbi:alpha-1,2-Mannosidase [Pleurostoma richardsiae]|uniref:alpha-1,2-Mannosidase n=1 Tax=Pleurostoma richardsiae TaxID=41990 RepID=A0AA38VTQ5_9PEZI|nr:alpha-1,2-Mannosidase [Pleurostoma richardsiae]
MRRRLRGRRKNVYLVCACSIAAFFFVFSAWGSQPSEFARLERFMNQEASSYAWETRNSFNWSSVHFQLAPEDVIALPKGKPVRLPRIQHIFRAESTADTLRREARRQEVRAVFLKNWHSYRKHAWMRDALLPISAGGKDQFSGWAATLVDSLDTLWIMGLREEFDEAVEAVARIDFGQASSTSVNMFETNIRYLGGLLAAYDLSGRSILLQKAVELGDLIYTGFNTEKRMPVDFIDFELAKTGQTLVVEALVVSASPGTLSLELTRLSQLTGNPKYYTAISRVMELFYSHQNETRLPGLWPTYVSMGTQNVVSGNQFTLGGCADSLYEYLPKMYTLLRGRNAKYETMSKEFMDAANRHLLFRPMLPGGEDILISGSASVPGDGHVLLDPESEHLACFLGGVFALGGRLFSRPDYVATGSRLALGCAYAYRAFPTGMMPERYNMVACKSRQVCEWDERAWDEARKSRPEWKEHLPLGFTTAKDPRYILRPEAIESLFVLYRITGLADFREAAWDMFQAVSNATATAYANAAVLDVTKVQRPQPQEDYMESFWLAETLKYYYLVFSPPDVINLDDWVFNTEAHPFRIPK